MYQLEETSFFILIIIIPIIWIGYFIISRWKKNKQENFASISLKDLKEHQIQFYACLVPTDDVFFIDGTVYEAISVNPVNNMYFNSNTYYLPKKQF